MNKKIPVQNSKKGQILLIEEKISKSNYIDLYDIIYSFSERNNFNEDGTINYSNYNSFKYDFDSIEEELGKIILPGVCQFENEDKLNFVTYWSEGFRGGRSQIFADFNLKYKQNPLTDQEKDNIIKYIKEKFPDDYDFKDFFGSIQMLIFYLTEMGIKEEEFDNCIKNPPEYLNLSEDCKNFFTNEEYKLNELKIDKIMDIFLFIEHFNFKNIIKTLHLIYKKEISDIKKNEIIKKLKQNNEEKITKKDLAVAVRRFISRYLAGNLEINNIKEEKELIEE
jgi:hypothetical protein